MAKKTQTSFMPETEIRAFETELASGELNTEDLAQNPELVRQFERLLRSYRLAANVANAAWFLVQSIPELLEGGEIDRGFYSVYNERVLTLQAALNEYAPKHFPRLPPQVVDALEQIYDEASQRENVPSEFLDWFFNAIQACRKT